MGPAWLTDSAAEQARDLARRYSTPDMAVVLGSGFERLSEVGEVTCVIGRGEIEGLPVPRQREREEALVVARFATGGAWIFPGRLHLYEGFTAGEVAAPVAFAAAAGARAVLLTCAAGGLDGEDRPGDFALVADHLNLTGTDPIRDLTVASRTPRFLDLHGIYDARFLSVWIRAAERYPVRLRAGTLAGLPGPCYETPAEIRMLRTMGADLVSMSTVLEAIAARYLGLAVAAVACVANPGAGMGDGLPIEHDGVLDTVREAVRRSGDFFRESVEGMIAELTPGR